ncbi:MAG: DUF1127 domain-containing protein [Pseudomonadota bacterium]
MATFDVFRPASKATPGLFANLIGKVVEWRDHRQTRDALSRLTDRELDDIGLRRADLDRAGPLRRRS